MVMFDHWCTPMHPLRGTRSLRHVPLQALGHCLDLVDARRGLSSSHRATRCSYTCPLRWRVRIPVVLRRQAMIIHACSFYWCRAGSRAMDTDSGTHILPSTSDTGCTRCLTPLLWVVG